MLLFPVKLGHFRNFTTALGSAVCVAASGCGYRPAYSAEAPVRLSVAAAPASTPHLEAIQSAVAGARAELSRVGALQGGTGYPRMMIEVARVDEVAAGIESAFVDGTDRPLATASAIGVVARAWIVRGEGAEPERDTGDVRRVVTVAQGSDPVAGGYAYDAAVRAAARRTGEALARRVLGTAEPGVEPM
jgi:hypothetical protein